MITAKLVGKKFVNMWYFLLIFTIKAKKKKEERKLIGLDQAKRK